MRRLLNTSILLALMTAGCGSDKDPTDPNDPGSVTLPQGSMSARIDGQSWAASAAITASWTNNLLVAAGTDGTNTVGFAVYAPAPGTYHLNSSVGMNALLTVAGSTVGWQAVGTRGSGTLTIQSISAAGASGTFSFVVVANDAAGSTRSITNGSFNLKF